MAYNAPVLGYTKEFKDLDQIWAEMPERTGQVVAIEPGDWERIESRLNELSQQIANFRREVQLRIVENAEPNPYDWIQHRFCLHHLLADLDETFLIASSAPRATESDRKQLTRALAVLDALHTPLYREFIEWHGKLEDQTDIPADLIKAFHEADSGKVVDMETALRDVPPEVDQI
jgi:hypothetical protein